MADRSDILMTCMRVYKEAFDRKMLETKATVRNLAGSQLDGIALLTGELFDLKTDDVKKYFDRCMVSWDRDRYLYFIPDDIYDVFRLEEKEAR